MSETLLDDIVAELNYEAIDEQVRINFQILVDKLRRIQDELNSAKQRIYDLENP